MTDANESAKEEAIKIPDVLPVLPLKDLVIFPFIIVPLSVSREKSINAVDQALAEDAAARVDPAYVREGRLERASDEADSHRPGADGRIGGGAMAVFAGV